MSSRRGRLPGASATSSRKPPYARPRPTTPPAAPSDEALDQQLARDPPPARAERGANRQLLLPASARTSSRFATLAQAISSTMPIVPISTHSTVPTSPTSRCFSGRDPARGAPPRTSSRCSPGTAGNCASAIGNHAGDIGVRLLERHARLQPRDAAEAEVAQEDLAAVEPERQDQRGLRSRNRNASGSTPMISRGRPSSMIRGRSTAGSPPNSRCQ